MSLVFCLLAVGGPCLGSSVLCSCSSIRGVEKKGEAVIGDMISTAFDSVSVHPKQSKTTKQSTPRMPKNHCMCTP